MNPLHPGVDPTVRAKDAIFFSPHKFIGGVDSPGILVAKKKLFKSSSPYTAGGGTVFYVRVSAHVLPVCLLCVHVYIVRDAVAHSSLGIHSNASITDSSITD